MRSVYTSKIISSHRDLVALVFYGTEQSKNPRNSFKHVYVYHDLDEPGTTSGATHGHTHDTRHNNTVQRAVPGVCVLLAALPQRV